MNGRSLEVRFRGPPGLERLEGAAREAVQARPSRGQVSVRVKATRARVGAGRRLDFLAEECMREANTLCSKSVLPSLTTEGLALRAAVDQLREQVQNVE